MVVTTLIVSGIPQHVTLTDLAYSLTKLFGEDEMKGVYHLRETKDHHRTDERQIAIDYDFRYDAVLAQNTLNGYEYQLPNGRQYTLRAYITKNELSEKEIRKQTNSPSPERVSYKRAYHRDNKHGVVSSIYFQRDSEVQMCRLNENMDKKIDILKKQKKLLAMERKVLKEKKRLKRELEDSDSNSDDGETCASIEKSRSKHKKWRRSRSVSRSRKSRRLKSSSSTSSSSASSNSSRERRRKTKYRKRSRRSSDRQCHHRSRSMSRDRHGGSNHRAKNYNRSRSRCLNSRSRYSRKPRSPSLHRLQSTSSYRKISRSRSKELEVWGRSRSQLESPRRTSRSCEDYERPSISGSRRKSSTNNVDSEAALALNEASKVLMKQIFQIMLHKIVLQENLQIPSKDTKAIHLLLTKAIVRKLESITNVEKESVSTIVKKFLRYYDEIDNMALIRKVLDNFRNEINEIESRDTKYALVSVSSAQKRNSSKEMVTADSNQDIIDLDTISTDETTEECQEIDSYCPNPSLRSIHDSHLKSTNEINLDVPLLPAFVPCGNIDVVEDKRIPENPRFIFPSICIMKQMKSALKELEIDSESSHLLVVRRIIRTKLRVIMAGKEYMGSSAIVKLFREHHPRASDKEFLQNIMNDIKAGLYVNDKDSDMENKSAAANDRKEESESDISQSQDTISSKMVKTEPTDISVEVPIESSHSDMIFKSEAPLELYESHGMQNNVKIKKENAKINEIDLTESDSEVIVIDYHSSAKTNENAKINEIDLTESEPETSVPDNHLSDQRKAIKQNLTKNHEESGVVEDMSVPKVKTESTEPDITVEVFVESSDVDMNFKSETLLTSDVAKMQDSYMVNSAIEIMNKENDNVEETETKIHANYLNNSIVTMTENDLVENIGAEVTEDNDNINVNNDSKEKRETNSRNGNCDGQQNTVKVEVKVEDDFDDTNLKKCGNGVNEEIISTESDHIRNANVDYDIKRIALNEDKINENGDELKELNKKNIHHNQILDEIAETKRKAQEDIDVEKDEHTTGIFTVTFNRDEESNRSTEDLLKLLSDD